MHTTKERLIAAGRLVGLGRSVEILKEQLVEELLNIIRTTPISEIVGAVKNTIEPGRPQGRGTPSAKVVVLQEGEHHVAQLPNGRTLRGKRRRDVVRRVRQQGFLLSA